MRKYQTFVVESKQKETALPTSASADVVQSKKRGDELLRELDAIYPTSSHLDSREFSSSSSRELTQFPQVCLLEERGNRILSRSTLNG